MREVWITRKGGPEVLEVRETSDPTPGPGEVRIRAHACGINFADIMARMGLYPDAPKLPCVVGYEVAGEVDAVGSGVTEFSVGQRVVALTRFGGYSDTVCVPLHQVAALSDDTSFEAAAALPVQYLTAWLMLVHLGNVREGDRVLVHAAGGGVGQAAVQICRWRGAEVIGTASAGKHDRLREMGVAHCIDYRSQDFEVEVNRITSGEGVDIALDAVGGKSFKKSYNVLTDMGRLFLFGASSFAPGEKLQILPLIKGMLQMPTFKPFKLMETNKGVLGVNLGHLWHKKRLIQTNLRDVVAKVDDGTFTPVIDATFPFDRAAEAHRYIQDRKNFGKVLLTPT